MITDIRIRNFKAFLDTGWIELNKLNYLMGANGSGKSSLSKSLDFMKHSLMQEPDAWGIFPSTFTMNIPDADLGTFGETLHMKSTEKSFSISYKISLDNKINSKKKWMKNPYVIEFQFKGNNPSTECYLSELTVSTFQTMKKIISFKNTLNQTTGDISTYNINLYQKNFHENGFNNQTLEKCLSSVLNKKEISIIKTRIWNQTLKESLLKISNHEKKPMKFDADDFTSENPFFSNSLLWLRESLQFAMANSSYINMELHKHSLDNLSLDSKDEELYDSSYEIRLIQKMMRSSRMLFHPATQTTGNIRTRTDSKSDSLSFSKWGNEFDSEDAPRLEYAYIGLFDPSMFMGDLLMQINSEIIQFHASIIHIHPDRASNQRLIERNRNSIDVWNRLNRDKNKDKKVDYILENLHDNNIQNIKIKPSPIDKYFSVEIKQQDGEHRNLMDIGFGYSQVLPVLFSCLDIMNNRKHLRKNMEGKYNYRDSIIIIEEPEVHTHPRLAALLAEFFKNFSRDFDGCRLLIESHSEHLLLKTQLLIKESPDYAKDNQILFLEKTLDKNNHSNSTIQKINFEKDGYLSDDFPDDFFDISYKLYSGLTS